MKTQQKDLLIIAILLTAAGLVFFKTPDIFASGLADSLSGKILLQVEQKGEAWYVNPSDKKRYYLGRPDDAFVLMRNFGVGVTNDNLNKIQIANDNLAGVADADGDGLSDALEDSLGTDKNKIDTDGDGYNDRIEILTGYNPLGAGSLPIDNKFAQSRQGKILLQVQKNGEAWYVNPGDNKRYFLGRPADAFALMCKLGLGITDSDLNKISLNQSSSDSPSIIENSLASSSPAQAFSDAPSVASDSSLESELVLCDSLDCLISAASICQISQATYDLTIPFPLAIRENMDTTIHSMIIGKNPDGSCNLTQQMRGSVVSISQDDKNIMLSLGLTNEQIDSQIGSVNELLNSDEVLKSILTCTGKAENIAAYLTSSKAGFKSLDCLLQGGERERECTIEPDLSCVMRMP